MKKNLALLFFLSTFAYPQWTNDPKVNTPVLTGPGPQNAPIGVSDGSGGAFAFCFFSQTGAAGIYVQHMDASGVRLFPAGGIQIFQKATVGVVYKAAIPDGNGGAIVAWSLNAVGDTAVHASKVSADGSLPWNAGAGVVVSDAPNLQSKPRIAPDSLGGAYVVWEDRRTGGVSKIYAQHLDASGLPVWAANGSIVCDSTPNSQFNPMVIPDGSGGCIIVWEDLRVQFQTKIYAQKLNWAGIAQWPDTGVAVYFYPTSPSLRGVAEDLAGGAFVCWQDRDHLGNTSVYVQRIDNNGTMVHDPFGERVTLSSKAVNPAMSPDGTGGAVVAWEDSTAGTREVNILAQRLNSNCTSVWVSPVTISAEPFEQYYFSMIPRGNDGAILAWTDARNWPSPYGLDIYAQSIDNAGNTKWLSGGDVVSQPNNATHQSFPVLVSDGAGGGIALWNDDRNSGTGSSTDIYAQGLAALGLPLSQSVPIVLPNTNYLFGPPSNTFLSANFSLLGSASMMTVDAYINTSPPGLAKALPRYFDISANGSGFDASLSFNYTDQEVAAIGLTSGDANLQLYRDEGSGWQLIGGTRDTAANTVTLANVTGFSRWALRDPLDTVVTGVADRRKIPTSFSLLQNYPNPFNPTTLVSFVISSASGGSFVNLKIYDVLGREVATLVNEVLPSGEYKRSWDAGGSPSGVYFCRLTAGPFSEIKKMVVIK